ncbi:hypothetical protein LTR64_006327 [Lithohypha guttulata]|uniref:uncharacterized protein n=1 Tax=Lithohypha guttulata TaxID=1690604 RepID=UPI002DE082C8|nr:hypothetical protein LTR51_001875 [Lithohypha guttulata]
MLTRFTTSCVTLAAYMLGSEAVALVDRHAAGCGKQHSSGYNSNLEEHRLVSKDVLRNYTIYVPTSYNNDPRKQWPLIIDYHGNGGNGSQQHDNSRYDKYTDDYLLVYPNGYEEHWQGPSYAVPGIDDLQFTTDLLAHLRTEYCIDDERIYASGKSNGGGFVDTLACSDNGNEFAAFSMAAAALYTDLSVDGCPYKRAILESHGAADNTIPYSPTKNGSGGALPQVADWVRWWAQRNGCDPTQAEVVEKPGYNHTSYSCQGANDVEHYKIFDLDHCWPSSSGDNHDYENPRCDDYSLDFTPVVLEFYSRWTLSSAPGAKDWRMWKGD